MAPRSTAHARPSRPAPVPRPVPPRDHSLRQEAIPHLRAAPRQCRAAEGDRGTTDRLPCRRVTVPQRTGSCAASYRSASTGGNLAPQAGAGHLDEALRFAGTRPSGRPPTSAATEGLHDRQHLCRRGAPWGPEIFGLRHRLHGGGRFFDARWFVDQGTLPVHRSYRRYGRCGRALLRISVTSANARVCVATARSAITPRVFLVQSDLVRLLRPLWERDHISASATSAGVRDSSGTVTGVAASR